MKLGRQLLVLRLNRVSLHCGAVDHRSQCRYNGVVPQLDKLGAQASSVRISKLVPYYGTQVLTKYILIDKQHNEKERNRPKMFRAPPVSVLPTPSTIHG